MVSSYLTWIMIATWNAAHIANARKCAKNAGELRLFGYLQRSRFLPPLPASVFVVYFAVRMCTIIMKGREKQKNI